MLSISLLFSCLNHVPAPSLLLSWNLSLPTCLSLLLNPTWHHRPPCHVNLALMRPLQVRHKLLNTRKRMEDILAGNKPNENEEWFETLEQLAEPLMLCYWSETPGLFTCPRRIFLCSSTTMHCY